MEKLVRDLIPDVMRAAGAHGRFRIAAKSERLDLLLEKLLEEAAELKNDPGIAELVDVIEVIRALSRELSLSSEQIETERYLKVAQKGGFDNGIVLCADLS